MEKYTIIVPVGDNMEALYAGTKDFPTEKVHLISPKAYKKAAEKAKKDLEKFHVSARIHDVNGDLWESVFKKITEIATKENDSSLLINVSTGDRITMCAATSAAFVNGVRAFSVLDGKNMMLPVLRFSYYKILNDKKMEMLRLIDEAKPCLTLEDLSKKMKMSLPLLSYHINGNLKAEGLKTMGLVTGRTNKRKVELTLAPLGKIMLDGFQA